MSCKTSLPLGAANCDQPYGDPRMLVISDDVIKYDDYADAQKIDKVTTAVGLDTAIVTKRFNNLEVTPSEEVNETNGYGENVFVKNTAGSSVAYLNSNPCDFADYARAFNGGTYFLEVLLTDNTKLLTKKPDGSLAPFKAQLNAIPVGMPGLENKIQQYRLNITWLSVEEWNNVVVVSLNDDMYDYEEIMPDGLGMDFVGAYTGTTQKVKLYERCSRTPVVAGTQFTAAVGVSNVLVAAIVPDVAGADSNGEIDLEITKVDGATALDAGDFIDFVLHDDVVPVTATTESATFKA